MSMTETIKITELKSAKWNPHSRTTPKAIKTLADSIGEHGQLVPIVVTENDKGYDIADGHRRVAAIELLGGKEVNAVIVSGLPQIDLYSELNGTARPLRGVELTDVALAGGNLRGQAAKCWQSLVDELGTKQLRNLHGERRFSPFWWDKARRLADYAGTEYGETFIWLVTSGTALTHVSVAMSGDMRPATLKRTIRSGKKLIAKIKSS